MELTEWMARLSWLAFFLRKETRISVSRDKFSQWTLKAGDISSPDNVENVQKYCFHRQVSCGGSTRIVVQKEYLGGGGVASTLSSPGRSHVGSLFTMYKKKRLPQDVIF